MTSDHLTTPTTDHLSDHINSPADHMASASGSDLVTQPVRLQSVITSCQPMMDRKVAVSSSGGGDGSAKQHHDSGPAI